MIGVRLGEDYEEKLAHLARQAKMKPGPFARRVLIAYMESQQKTDTVLSGKLSRIEEFMPRLARLMLRLDEKVTTFLEQVEIAHPT